MPTSEVILNGLMEISNTYRPLAMIWHLYLVLIAIGLIAGRRISRRLMGVLLALPLFSVSVLAWLTSNPFNGAVFAAGGVALIAISIRMRTGRVAIAPPWMVVSGAIMLLFGLLYPHFLKGLWPLAYVYSAPTGLIPCPTLSALIGLSLITGCLGSRAWTVVLGAMGLFYGFFGAVRLGVALDWVLIAGSFNLILSSYLERDIYSRPEPAA